jgi:alkanesulfonate monooxygenase SsuD/methylene tetrahydromethanopterin reductase-like flavin-dependent oxidoreductase (luciferase family)
LRYGIFDHLDHAAGALNDLYAMRLALIEKYDAAGFYAYHLAEHHGTKLGAAPSPGLFLAAAAQRSKKLRLGAMVFCIPLYHPIRLLEEICMLDQMSNGRLELGIGRGISPIEGDFFGVAAEDAPEMYREGLDLILAGLKGGDLNFSGERYRVPDMPMVLEPKQRPHPPLWVGIGAPDSAVWPAQNDINIISNVGADRMRSITDRYRQEWQGRDHESAPLMGLTRHIVIEEDRDVAWNVARRAYKPWRAAFMRLWDRAGIPLPNFSLPVDFDGLAAEGKAIVGTPDEVAAEVKTQIADSGINYFLCRFAFGDITLAEASRSLDLFKVQVMDRSG